jgi:hypothetical protein
VYVSIGCVIIYRNNNYHICPEKSTVFQKL